MHDDHGPFSTKTEGSKQGCKQFSSIPKRPGHALSSGWRASQARRWHACPRNCDRSAGCKRPICRGQISTNCPYFTYAKKRKPFVPVGRRQPGGAEKLPYFTLFYTWWKQTLGMLLGMNGSLRSVATRARPLVSL
eukprot:658268-Pleurochrysis_carterae.AAC.1